MPSNVTQFPRLEDLLAINKTNILVNENQVVVDGSYFTGLVVCFIMVVPINLVVLSWITTKVQSTLVDKMVLLDCVANIGTMALFMTVSLGYPC